MSFLDTMNVCSYFKHATAVPYHSEVRSRGEKQSKVLLELEHCTRRLAI